MKKLRNILALLLCLCLLCPALPAAAYEDAVPTVRFSLEKDGSVQLRLTGLVENTVLRGVQLEVTLQGDYEAKDIALTPADSLAFSPAFATPVSKGGGKTTVTLYLVSAYALNTDTAVALGSLTAKGQGVFPLSARLGLLCQGDTEISMADAPVGPAAEFPFTDVRASDWFYGPVLFARQHGLMSGVETTLFGPHTTTTRGMIVTILHNLEGNPEPSSTGTFSDVNSKLYYAAPIEWASSNGIVSGYGGGIFRPDRPISRQELAAILYNYAKYKGRDVTATGDLSAFTDGGKVATYAQDAMRWAVGSGIINGKGNGLLDPLGGGTRAEAATVLKQYITSE